jgi:hypothetical protein
MRKSNSNGLFIELAVGHECHSLVREVYFELQDRSHDRDPAVFEHTGATIEWERRSDEANIGSSISFLVLEHKRQKTRFW